MKGVFVFLADGFEEIEALATVDILRRGGIDVKTVSISHDRTVRGAHGVPVGPVAVHGPCVVRAGQSGEVIL